MKVLIVDGWGDFITFYTKDETVIRELKKIENETGEWDEEKFLNLLRKCHKKVRYKPEDADVIIDLETAYKVRTILSML